MGNRALLTFSTEPTAPAIYLHWNGGRASVLGFLKAARQLGIAADCNPSFSEEELRDALGNMIARRFFGVRFDEMHAYRAEFGEGMDSDNGVFLLNRELEIVDRLQAPPVDEIDAEKTRLICEAVLEDQSRKQLERAQARGF
jgi:hypothetical protein